MRLLIMGPQGVGKGTQAALLAEHYGIPAISTGDIFRYNIKNKTELGLEALKYTDKGELVPDELTNKIVKDRLAMDDAKNGWILDGYPRNASQVKALDAMLEELGTPLDKVVALDADHDVLMQRIAKRAQEQGRSDDTPEAIAKRLATYAKETAPLLDTYKSRGQLVAIDGVGDIDAIQANIVAALFGGMGGCAMIGQSVINVTSGGRGRLSTFVAGAFLLFLLAVLGPWVGRVPMPALVAVMIMVSIGTFSWNSLRNLGRHPPTSSIVMLVTVAVVVATRDLSLGVLAGVLLSGVFFAGKVQRMFAVERIADDGGVTYRVTGQIFFASVDRFRRGFAPEGAVPVTIDVGAAHFWDISGVDALDKIVVRLRQQGATITVIGYNRASADLVDRFALHDRTGVELGVVPH